MNPDRVIMIGLGIAFGLLAVVSWLVRQLAAIS